MSKRWLRTVLVAVGLLVLPTSASAASQFITSKGGTDEPLAVRGSSGTDGAQTIDLPPFRVSCQAARSTGGPSPGYTELRDNIKFSRCTTAVSIGSGSITIPARVKGAMDLFHKGNGNSELVNPFEVVLPSLKCKITIEESRELVNLYTEPTGGGGGVGKIANPYENIGVPTRNLHSFPGGYQQRLQIHNRLIGLFYGFTGSCANLEPGIGEYGGVTVEEAVGADLQFVESEAEPEG